MTEEERKPRIHRVRVWPEAPLHEKAEPVTAFAKGLRRLVEDMFATMVANQGVGLAAPQIGIKQRIITIRIEDKKPYAFVNPEITEQSEELFEFEEGCLSVPGYFENRKRPKQISVKYQDVKGVEREEIFFDLYAFAIQHEMDHLDGKVFVDDLSFFKKSRVKKKIKKSMPELQAKLRYAEAHLDEWWAKVKEIDKTDEEQS